MYALETRTRLWLGHGCFCNRMVSKHERDYGKGHAWSGNRMPSKHERDNGWGLDTLVTRCSATSPHTSWPSSLSAAEQSPERSPMALSCPAATHCEYGHKTASGSLGSAQDPTPVSEIQLLRSPQNSAVTPDGREEPVSLGV